MLSLCIVWSLASLLYEVVDLYMLSRFFNRWMLDQIISALFNNCFISIAASITFFFVNELPWRVLVENLRRNIGILLKGKSTRFVKTFVTDVNDLVCQTILGVISSRVLLEHYLFIKQFGLFFHLVECISKGKGISIDKLSLCILREGLMIPSSFITYRSEAWVLV